MTAIISSYDLYLAACIKLGWIVFLVLPISLIAIFFASDQAYEDNIKGVEKDVLTIKNEREMVRDLLKQCL